MEGPARRGQQGPAPDEGLRRRIDEARRRLGGEGRRGQGQGWGNPPRQLEQLRQRMQSPEMKKRLEENPQLRERLMERIRQLREGTGPEMMRPQGREMPRGRGQQPQLQPRQQGRGQQPQLQRQQQGRGQQPQLQWQQQGRGQQARQPQPQRIDSTTLERFKAQLKREILAEIKKYIDSALKKMKK